MRNVYIASDNIISPLGFTTRENIESLKAGFTGITYHEDPSISPLPFWASRINHEKFSQRFAAKIDLTAYTRFEGMVIASVSETLQHKTMDVSGPKTLMIISTTKGNIDLLAGEPASERIYLWNSAITIQKHFKLFNTPWVVSNACISGVLASIIASRLIRAGKYDQVIVTGADMVTEFVLSGFNSFLSLCTGPCKPFDKNRQGLSLGEAAGTIIYTSEKPADGNESTVKATSGSSSNDANHISGPSRTGEGLYIAIRKTLEHFEEEVDYISAHGTATPYNDEMESVALTRAGLNHVPVNSLKGFWGHTLGAAGIIESVACIHTLKSNFLFKTLGFSESGVSNPLAIIERNTEKPVQNCLKMASGFGGSNAALLFCKE